MNWVYFCQLTIWWLFEECGRTDFSTQGTFGIYATPLPHWSWGYWH